jgi:DNA replication protein DnaC
VLTRRPTLCRPFHPQNRDRIRPSVRAVLNDLVTGRADCADWPLYLWGDTGCGKTSAALCLVNVVADSWYTTLNEMAEVVFEVMPWEWREGVRRLLLAVDEIGLDDQPPSRYEKIAMEQLADARQYEPTIWLSNLSPEDGRNQVVERYGDRVYSRICSGTVVHHGGPDRRFHG